MRHNSSANWPKAKGRTHHRSASPSHTWTRLPRFCNSLHRSGARFQCSAAADLRKHQAPKSRRRLPEVLPAAPRGCQAPSTLPTPGCRVGYQQEHEFSEAPSLVSHRLHPSRHERIPPRATGDRILVRPRHNTLTASCRNNSGDSAVDLRYQNRERTRTGEAEAGSDLPLLYACSPATYR